MALEEENQTYRRTPSDMFTKTSAMAGLLACDRAPLVAFPDFPVA